MASIRIARIAINDAGELRVHPRVGTSFEFVYRAAMGVHWYEGEAAREEPCDSFSPS